MAKTFTHESPLPSVLVEFDSVRAHELAVLQSDQTTPRGDPDIVRELFGEHPIADHFIAHNGDLTNIEIQPPFSLTPDFQGGSENSQMHVDYFKETIIGYSRLPTRLLIGKIAIKTEDWHTYNTKVTPEYRCDRPVNPGFFFFKTDAGIEAIQAAIERGDLEEKSIKPGNLITLAPGTLHSTQVDTDSEPLFGTPRLLIIDFSNKFSERDSRELQPTR